MRVSRMAGRGSDHSSDDLRMSSRSTVKRSSFLLRLEQKILWLDLAFSLLVGFSLVQDVEDEEAPFLAGFFPLFCRTECVVKPPEPFFYLKLRVKFGSDFLVLRKDDWSNVCSSLRRHPSDPNLCERYICPSFQ